MWTRSTAIKDEVVIKSSLFNVFSTPKHDEDIANKLKECRLKQVYSREKMQCLKKQN